MKKHKLLLCIALWFCLNLVAGREVVFANEENLSTAYELEPVIVHPSVLEQYYSDSLRQIAYSQAQPRSLGNYSADHLKGVSSLDVLRRGPYNVQADMQIRAAGFEQTDVLINGVKVNDPQTGHFNMDIPFFAEDISKTVIIAGPASAVNGAGRQGGSVHLLISKPTGSGVQASTIFGSHNFSGQTVSVGTKIGDVLSRSSIGRVSSDGYRYNTDFDSIGFSHVSGLETGLGETEFIFGWMDKEFGANGFYSEFYPEQKEYTNTAFASVGLKSEVDSLFINPQLYLRRHNDRYMLNKNNPAFYENIHTSYVQGAKVDAVYEFSESKIYGGIDIAEDKIKSTNLGKHNRSRNTVYAVYNPKIDDFIFSLGGAGYFFEGVKDQLVPDLGAGYFFNDNIKARCAFNRSFRAPTFTELYYRSPANIGNDNLAPEKSDNYEYGLDYNRSDFCVSLTVFHRNEKNLIDWVRSPGSTVYYIKNITKVNTDGFDAAASFYPGGKRWKELSLGYSYIDRDEQEDGLISKYVFDYLEHKITAGTKFALPFELESGFDLVYQQRSDQGGDFVADASLEKKIKELKVFVRADNLFNHGYREKGNIPMPGRELFAGAEISW